MKLQKTCELHIQSTCIIFFLLAGTTLQYQAIYTVFRYFASLTGYDDNILQVISYLHVQSSKFGGKLEKIDAKYEEEKKFNPIA